MLILQKRTGDTKPSGTTGNTAFVATLADRLKDTTLLFSKDIYLWYEQIPTSFNARSYNDPAGIMTAIRAYSNEPGFTGPADRWSFAVKQTEWDKVSAGIAGDFGLDVFFHAPNDLRVKSVEKESPAGRAGVRRGWRITRINNNSNITTGNTDFVVSAVLTAPPPPLLSKSRTAVSLTWS
jgi:hypothetical protein